MIEVKRPESLFGGEIGKPISAALLILIVILLMVSSYQISKRWMKKPLPKKNEVDKRILNKEIHGFSMPTNITFRRAHY
jgi:hypothetical protein